MFAFMLLSLQETMSECTWMTSGRIWRPTVWCSLDSKIDLAEWNNPGLKISNYTNSSSLDLTVVNVPMLSIRHPGEYISLYSLIDLEVDSSISNAFFAVNVTIDMSAPENKYTKELIVSIFESVIGSLYNVTVVGEIRIVNLDYNVMSRIELSRMLGTTGVDEIALRDVDAIGGNFQNISSSLKYFINGQEINFDNQTVAYLDSHGVQQNSVKIRYQDVLDMCQDGSYLVEPYNLTVFDIHIPQLHSCYSTCPPVSINNKGRQCRICDSANGETAHNLTLADMLKAPYNVQAKETKFYSEVTNSVFATTIYFGFDYVQHRNAFIDFYPQLLVNAIEGTDQINGMPVKFFDAQQNELPISYPDSDIHWTVYYTPNKAVGIKKENGTDMDPVTCKDGDVYDLDSNNCTTSIKCTVDKGYYLFETMCLKYCFNNFRVVKFSITTVPDIVNQCVYECPMDLGYVEPATPNNADPVQTPCVRCSDTGMVASSAGCVALDGLGKCPSGKYLLSNGKACFSVCPDGTYTDTTNMKCIIPSSLADCNNTDYPYFVAYSQIVTGTNGYQRYNNICQRLKPYGLYRMLSTNEYRPICTGSVRLDFSCDPDPNGKCDIDAALEDWTQIVGGVISTDEHPRDHKGNGIYGEFIIPSKVPAGTITDQMDPDFVDDYNIMYERLNKGTVIPAADAVKTTPQPWALQILRFFSRVFNAIRAPTKNGKDCHKSCPDPLVDVFGECQKECPDMTYKQTETGTCNLCGSSLYDGGTLWNRTSRNCTDKCVYFNMTYGEKFCEGNTTSIEQEFCKIKKIDPYAYPFDEYLCLDHCYAGWKLFGDLCVSNCRDWYVYTALGATYDKDQCLDTCPDAYFTLESLPDRSKQANCYASCAFPFATRKNSDHYKGVNKDECFYCPFFVGADQVCRKTCEYVNEYRFSSIGNAGIYTSDLYGDIKVRTCETFSEDPLTPVADCPKVQYVVMEFPHNLKYSIEAGAVQKLCRADCSGMLLLEEKNRCYTLTDGCPEGYSIDHTKTKCVKICASGYLVRIVSNLRTCELVCSAGQLVNLSSTPVSCVVSTPSINDKFYEYDNGNKIVIDSCAGFQYLDSAKDANLKRCEKTCAVMGIKFQIKNTCVPSCKDHSTNNFVDNSTNECLKECPSGRFLLQADGEYHCQAAFEDTKTYITDPAQTPLYLSEQADVVSCASLNPAKAFKMGETCVAACPSTAALYNSSKICSSACVGTDIYNENGFCVPACASSTFDAQNVCVPAATCTATFSGLCVKCAPKQFVSRATQKCVDTCAYVNGVFCEEPTDAVNCPKFQVENGQKVCKPSCTLELNNECFAVCPQGYTGTTGVCAPCADYYKQDKTCVPEAAGMIYTKINGLKILVDNCDTGYWIQENANVKHCESKCELIDPIYKFAVNQICVTSCRSTANTKFVANKTNQCVDVCQSGFYWKDAAKEVHCLDKRNINRPAGIDKEVSYYQVNTTYFVTEYDAIVEENGWFNYTTIQKPKQVEKWKWVETIVDYFKGYQREENDCRDFLGFEFGYNNQCVSACPAAATYYMQDHKCVANCIDTTEKFVVSQTSLACLPTCVDDSANDKQFYQEQLPGLLVCVSECLYQNFTGVDIAYHPTLIRCEDSCLKFKTARLVDPDPLLTNPRKCIAACGPNKTFISENNFTCVEKCRSKIFVYQNGVMRCVVPTTEETQCIQLIQRDVTQFNTVYLVPAVYNDYKLCIKCPVGQFILRTTGECTETCSFKGLLNANDKYYCEAGIDAVKCPFTKEGTQCITVDESKNMVILGTECFTKTQGCPLGKIMDVTLSKCLDKCEDGQFISIVLPKFCKAGCAYIYNKTDQTCTDPTAPTYYSVLDGTKHIKANCDVGYWMKDTTNANSIRCEVSCAAMGVAFQLNFTCVPSCRDHPTNKFVANKTNDCVEECYSGLYERKGREIHCIEKSDPKRVVGIDTSVTEDEFVGYQREADDCSTFGTAKFTNGITCQLACPPEKPYYTSTFVCVSSCVGTAENFVLSVGSMQCIKECPTEYYYSASGIMTCVDTCNTVTKSTGIDKYSATRLRCEDSCSLFTEATLVDPDFKPTTATNRNKCISQCRINKPFVTEDKSTCTATCGSSKFVVENSQPRCVTTCTGTLVLNDQVKVGYEQCLTCVAPLLTDRTTGACVAPADCTRINGSYCENANDTVNCPKFQVLADKTTVCKFTCPEIEYKNQCFSTTEGCPTPLFVDALGKTCVESCVSGQITITSPIMKCTTGCTGTDIFNLTTQSCVTPTVNPTYYKVVNDTKIIVPNCNNGYQMADLPPAITIRCEENCSVMNVSYQLDNKCIVSCLAHPTNKFVAADGKTCVDECNTTLFSKINNQYQCVSKNTSQVTGVDTQITDPFFNGYKRQEDNCTDYGNNYFQDLMSCVQVCPPVRSYYTTNFICTDNCKNTNQKFIEAGSKKCQEQCKTMYYHLVGTDLVCTSACTSKVSGFDVIHSNTTLRCEVSCSAFDSAKLIDPDYSISTSTGSAGLVNCIAECRNDKPYISIDGTTCVAECNPKLFTIENGKVHCRPFGYCGAPVLTAAIAPDYYQCLCTAPLLTDRTTGACVAPADCTRINGSYCENANDTVNCPKFQVLADKTTVCEFTCPEIEYKNQCFNTTEGCPTPLFVDALGKTCVESCTDGAVIDQTSLLINKCKTGCGERIYNNHTDKCMDLPTIDPIIYYEVVNGTKVWIPDCNGRYWLPDPTSSFARRCEDNCTVMDIKFQIGWQCIPSCFANPTNKFVSINGYECVDFCFSGLFQKDPAGELHCIAKNDSKVTGIDTTIVPALPTQPPIYKQDDNCTTFGDNKYQYGMTCVKECPADKPFYTSDFKCATTCMETNEKFVQTDLSNACSAVCQTQYYQMNDNETSLVCLTNCSKLSTSGLDITVSNTTLRCSSACSDLVPFQLIDPDYKVAGRVKCIPECRADKPFISVDNTTCVAGCDTQTIIIENGVPRCVKQDELINECRATIAAPQYGPDYRQCIKCSGTQFVDRVTGKCIDNCTIIGSNPAFCETTGTDDCPFKVVKNGQNYCVKPDCASQGMLQLNDTCYTQEQGCPAGTAIEGTQCVTKCAVGSVMYTDVVLKCIACPAATPYFNPATKTCVNSGDYYEETNGSKVIVPDCNNKTYLKPTPDVKPYRCEANCSVMNINYQIGSECIASCFAHPTNKFIGANNSCVDECYSGLYSKVDGQFYCVVKNVSQVTGIDSAVASDTYFSGYKRQEDNCTDYGLNYFQDIMECVPVCPAARSFYTSKFICTESCMTTSEKFVQTSTSKACIAECKTQYYEGLPIGAVNSLACLEHCPSNKVSGFDKFSNNTLRCEADCSAFGASNLIDPDFSVDQGSGVIRRKCMEECRADKPFVTGTPSTCTDTCTPAFITSVDSVLTCTTSCTPSLPVELPAPFTGYQQCCAASELINRTNGNCVSSCTRTNGSYCENANDTVNCPKFQVIGLVTVCLKNCTGFVELNGQCYKPSEGCPTGYLMNAAKTECVTACLNKTIVDQTSTPAQCRSGCGTSIYDPIKNECLVPTVIPTYYKIVNDTKILVPNCDNGYWMPDEVYPDVARRCEDNCSVMNIKYHIDFQCVPSCFATTNKFVSINGQECVDFCASALYSKVNGEFQCAIKNASQVTGKDPSVNDSYFNGYDRQEDNCTDYGINKFQYKMTCLKECPSDKPFYTSKFICATTCMETDEKFVEYDLSKECISQCKTQYYQTATASTSLVCTQSCPTNNAIGFDSYSNTTYRCEASCTKFNTSVLVNPGVEAGGHTTCISTCPTTSKFITVDGLTCTATCDKQIFEMLPVGIIKCLDSCVSTPILNDAVMNGYKQCIICSNYTERDTGKCVSTCDYINGSYCENFCKPTQVINNLTVCSTNCSGKLELDNECHDIAKGCPEPYFMNVEKTKCVTKCDAGTLPVLNVTPKQCKPGCGKNIYDPIKDICFVPTNDTYYEEDNGNKVLVPDCNNKYWVNDTDYPGIAYRCEITCPAMGYKYRFGWECVPSCRNHSTNKFVANATIDCVDECYSKHYWVDADMELHCITTTDSSRVTGVDPAVESDYFHGYFREDNNCAGFGINKYQNGKTCNASCDASMPFNTPDLKCSASCTTTDFKFIQTETSKQCIAACDFDYYGTTATSGIELVCAQSCPSGTKISGFDAYSTSKLRCELSCSAFLTTKLVDPDFMLGSRGKCIDKCRPNKKFIDAAGLTCVDTCASSTFSIVNSVPKCDTCGTSILNDAVKTGYSQCITCPQLTDRQTGACVSTCERKNGSYCESKNDAVNCPKFQVIGSDTSCRKDCAGLVELNGQCFTTTEGCPTGYVMNVAQTQCLPQCESGTLLNKVATPPQCIAGCGTKIYDNSASNPANCIEPTGMKYFSVVNGNKVQKADCIGGYWFADSDYPSFAKRCESNCQLMNIKYQLDSECIVSCKAHPTNKFVNNNKCVDECYSGLYTLDADKEMHCVITPDTTKVVGVDPSIVYTQVAGYLKQDKDCTTFGANKFYDGNACVSACPAGKPYYTSKFVCAASCMDTDEKFIATSGSLKCVAECQTLYYQKDGDIKLVCLSSCSSGKLSGFDSYSATKLRCEGSCTNFKQATLVDPDYNVAGRQQCISACRDSKKFISIDGTTCVESCASKLFVLSNGKLQCQASCLVSSLNELEQGKQMYSQCFNCGQDQTDRATGQCVSDCQRINGSFCESADDKVRCPNIQVVSNKTICVANCNGMLELNGQCFTFAEGCPSGFMNAERTQCFAQCPEGQLIVKNSDVKQCKLGCGNMIYNESTDSCIDPTKNISQLFFFTKQNNNRIQVEKCDVGTYYQVPGEVNVRRCEVSCEVMDIHYQIDRECIVSCRAHVSNKFVANDSNQCFDECYSGFYWVDESTVAREMHCLNERDPTKVLGIDPTATGSYFSGYYRQADDCTGFGVNKFQDGFMCVSQCPEERKYYSSKFVCTATCKTTTEKFINVSSSLQCIDSCRYQYYFQHTNGELVCLGFCKKAESISGYDTFGTKNLRCESSCTKFDTAVLIDPVFEIDTRRKCIDKCDTVNKFVSENKLTCQPTCTTPQFVVESSRQRCKAASETCTTVIDNQCIQCLANEVVDRISGACMVRTKCGQINGSFCEHNCPRIQVISGESFCKLDCSGLIDYKNQQCYDQTEGCPAGLFVNKDKTTCIESCEVGTLINPATTYKSCKPGCNAGEVYSVENNVCFTPTTTTYYTLDNGNKILKDKCNNGIFVQESANLRQCGKTCAEMNIKYTSQDGKQCVASCKALNSFVSSTNQCVATCTLQTYQKLQDGELQCVDILDESKVTGVDPSVDAFVPTGYKKQDADCTTFGLNKFQYGTSCVAACTTDKKFYTSKFVCTSSCIDTNEKFINESASLECISTCRTQYYEKQGTNKLVCLTNCPSDTKTSGFDLYSSSILRCDSDCSKFASANLVDPNFSINQRKKCISTCPTNAKFVTFDKKTCTADCQSQLFVIEKGVPRCVYNVALCRLAFAMDNVQPGYSQCIPTSCKSGWFVQRTTGTCVQTCQNIALNPAFCEDKVTSTNCPKIQMIEGSTYCVSSCDALELNGQCYTQLEGCPSGYSISINKRTCVQQCESGTMPQINNGISACTLGCGDNIYDEVNKVCINASAIPESDFYYRVDNGNKLLLNKCDGFWFQDTTSTNMMRCEASCDVMGINFQVEKQCFKSCKQHPTLKFVSNISNECVASCRSGIYFKDAQKELHCVTKKDTTKVHGIDTAETAKQYIGYLREDSSCSDFGLSIFQDGLTCLTSCPTDRKYYTSQHICTSSCTLTNDKFVQNETSLQCISKCGTQYYQEYTAGVLICLVTCDSSRYSGYDYYQINQPRCADACTQFHDEHYISPNPILPQRRKCITTCPEPWKFISEDKLTCVKQCSQGLFQVLKSNKLACQTQCSFPYFQGQTLNTTFGYYSCESCSPLYMSRVQQKCVVDCDYISAEDPQICEASGDSVHCPFTQIKIVNGVPQSFCLSSCAAFGLLQAGNECYTKVEGCPRGLMVNAAGTMCVSECDPGTLVQEKNGIQYCEEGCGEQVYDPYANECIGAVGVYYILVNDNKILHIKCSLDVSPNKALNNTDADGHVWSFFDGIGTRCLLNCEEGNFKFQIIADQTCVNECPQLSAIVNSVEVCVDYQYCDYFKNGKCIDTCELTFNNMCVDKCTADQVQNGSICYDWTGCTRDILYICEEPLSFTQQQTVKSGLNSGSISAIVILAILAAAAVAIVLKMKNKEENLKIKSGQGDFYANECDKAWEMCVVQKMFANAEEDEFDDDDEVTRHMHRRIVVEV
ncbi:Conserved_hypothetical protein [Hexamita inflata]|uniref:Uncharacterized protein n=1 Tax=Hexamita inflata TaxID=28002 RepID=A0AA86RB73_9EUKA|nr:Conserved hypothetical protein [Hexamita inflata]